jgi:membrane-associated phospholipid phosphatase
MKTHEATKPVGRAALSGVLRTERLIWLLILAMFALAFLAYAAAGLAFDFRSCGLVAGLWLGCLAIAGFYRHVRFDWRISFGAASTCQVLAILVLAALTTYPAATADFPYRDADLAAIDHLLGLDWRSYLAFVDAHPLLADVLRLAYGSMQPQFALVIAVLTATGRYARQQRYTIALAIALAVALPIFTLMPAVAAYAHFAVAPTDFAHVHPAVPYAHIAHLESLRNGTRTVISMTDLEGIITFPSFHTAAAVMFVWALWPVVWLRFLAVPVNLLLIASTPVQGAHYFIDLIGGVGIALFAILAATALLERRRLPAMPGRPQAATGDRPRGSPIHIP